ncbi:NAD(P)H-hydrate dehydratase [Pararobbsia silviterrae]|uniref:Bifunctional NAD(P)H-hydrate repair enzyme n=1 Tax=Pararobbsia silviterrae TaxID=1792498 RepID=A0A494Y4B5_9BURK|nr:NAD(P)H-hydrate dehydratase [Pararobbsia silviterrae]RKP54746.1 NAD(P)H-hydrate dehydratase [Pararobbsia silviterrae]
MTDLYVSTRDRALPLYTVEALRAAERDALAQLPPHTLMARAGAAAAQFLAQRLAAVDARHRSVWFAAGPGNNGGDALIAAAELKRQGFAVGVALPVESKPDDARWALASARAAGVRIDTALPASLDECAWLVDGVLGIGVERAFPGDDASPFNALAHRLESARTRGLPILALDVPSGLDSDTGQAVGGGTPVIATHTLTFIAAKPGLFTGRGRDYAGEVSVAPIGLDAWRRTPAPGPDRAPDADADFAAPGTFLNAPERFAPHLPRRHASAHKGTFGTLAVVGGASGMMGAPILAARAALYAGSGKIHVAFLGPDFPPYDPPHPELMLGEFDALALERMSAIAIGCGMGSGDLAHRALLRVLALDIAKVVDADALNGIAQHADAATRLREHATHAVLTPHPLEAARLLGTDVANIERDRVRSARTLATRFGTTVVLKGSGTVIASGDARRVAINPTGNAGLATGGSGDTLGGMIGALLAQRMPAFEAACAGVFLHGRAADALTEEGQGPAGLTAGELAPAFRRLFNTMLAAPVRDPG